VIVVEQTDELFSLIGDWKKQGLKIALVPTMGYFHEGHLSLMREARRRADKIVVSLFVNPRQFGPNEDLDKYPRNLASDTKLAEQEHVDILFFPSNDVMYPEGYQTTIAVPGLSHLLCGRSRPGHFDGVATVVAKLFNLVQPEIAIFGRKDYQQLSLIRQMVLDLNFNIEIVGHQIVREPSGLAMSSRNKYLDEQEKKDALCLYKGLQHGIKRISQAGTLEASVLIHEIRDILDQVHSCEIDYVAIVDPITLTDKDSAQSGDVLALAAYFNKKVRLIDNTTL
jgi:pantoate--beta-alanine ligase